MGMRSHIQTQIASRPNEFNLVNLSMQTSGCLFENANCFLYRGVWFGHYL